MEKDRSKAGKKASTVAIVSNCLLTVLNIVVGLMGGSYALVAEGMHTFTDVITSIIAYIGFKVSQRPADERFPIGYGRADAIAGLVIVIFLTFISFEIMDMAYHKLVDPSMITVPDNYVVIMAILGIILNFVVSRYIIKIGREINSPAIEADGQHQRVDIYTSIAILIGVVVARMSFPILDPIIGFLIGVLILITVYVIGKKNLLRIMGAVPENKELVSKIKSIVDDTTGARNAHNIKMDNFASYIIVALDVEVDADLTVKEAYEISCQVEQKILELPEVRDVSVKTCPSN
ncbi:cation transporter [Methanobrevibacter sp. YE315]|uniref:cation diffusion facilitator family transporter n=1 Tax=Methanobrevibacter sp. YE315 TaxID=1609968 RepID=UPI000764ED66|nr:cation diffusion facilitator family transporter [Methanobrevibacter sp. YE315]AMD17881.1 cation transporter [Methanobrevibacter sp. YE315]